ncbi:MAG TPA: hypothetical protein DCW60_00010 [Sutterella sp.]|nr:hypothetical protein [Sutterella sp.]
MLAYIWPIALVIVANVVYQVCAKAVPADMSPLASLTVVYFVAFSVSALLYFVLTDHPNLVVEYTKINWAPFAFGIVLVGLEVGFIFAYKAGWPVSTAATVQSAFVAVALVFVGALFYGETINASKVIGVVLCLFGLYFLNQN